MDLIRRTYANFQPGVPQLTEIACEIIQKEGCPFTMFMNDAGQSRILRGRVASWVNEVWAEFDRVGLMASVSEEN